MEGGRMSLDDVPGYEVQWADAEVCSIPGGYAMHINPAPNLGGTNLIEALNLAAEAKLTEDGPWWKSGQSLRKALDITSQLNVSFLPDEMVAQVYPDLDFSPKSRLTRDHAKQLWARMEAGAKLGGFSHNTPRHSDDVVAVDRARESRLRFD